MRDVHTIKRDAAARWRQELGQQIKECGFTCTVGTNQRMDVPALNFQIHIINSDESLEFFAQIARFKNEFR